MTNDETKAGDKRRGVKDAEKTNGETKAATQSEPQSHRDTEREKPDQRDAGLQQGKAETNDKAQPAVVPIEGKTGAQISAEAEERRQREWQKWHARQNAQLRAQANEGDTYFNPYA